MGLAFLASSPHAKTCPRSSYKRHVGTLRNVSNEPGQCRICWMTPDAMREDAYACYQRIRSVHRSNCSSVPRTTPEKVVPKRTARQHDVSQTTEKNVTKIDGDGHPALVRSPAVLVSARRRDRVRQGPHEGRGRRRMPLHRCVDRTGLVQRRRCPRVGTLTNRKIEIRVGWSHLHVRAHGQHALVDAPWRGRRRPMAPWAWSAVNQGVVGLKARWRWGGAAGRQ
jgi:hypothetical protein